MFNFLRRLLPKKEVVPVVSHPMDQSMLKCFVNCRVKGTMTLPSGQVIPAPPAGKVWLVDRGVITLAEDND
jgi:hypothetical protein